MNAVIYARYSSDKQTEQSIEGQLRVCQEYAARNDITIIDEYIDRAMTGTNDKRPAFLQMIEDSEKKQFEYILVYKLDRFSRNKYDNVIYKHKLEQYGVKVISATEVISDTPEGHLMEGLLEMFAEMYSRELSQKVKRGMRESLIKGNSIGGQLLYGYKVVDKKIQIDEEKAKFVRYFFAEYAKGKSKVDIINELNSMGGNFNRNSFQNTLSNKKYIGIYDNGEIVNNNYYPPIISEEVFNAVQQRLVVNKRLSAQKKSKENFILTGKLFCAKCGASMVGTSGKKSYFYYVCTSRFRKHTCDKSIEKKEDIESFIVEQTLLRIKKDKEEIIQGMLKQWSKPESDFRIKECERNIKRVEKELDTCFELLLNNSNNQEMIKRINEKADSLTVLKEDLEKERDRLTFAKGIAKTEQNLRASINAFLEKKPGDISYKERIIKHFVNTVYVSDEELTVFYNVFKEKSPNTIPYEEYVRILNGMVDHYIYYPNKYIFLDDYFGIIFKKTN